MSTPTVDPFDELASMFISNPQAGAAAVIAGDSEAIESNPVAIDLLLVGHLPVRGGLWITPYVDAIARTAGPIGLVRLDGPEPTVQLLRGHRDRAATVGRDLLDAVDGLADVATRWVVRPPHDAAPEDLLACSINRVTILSSADEAAVVAAYQVIKSWVTAANEAGVELPPIDVAIVGADEQRATIAFERIRRTAEARLDRTVTHACCLSQIDANIEATSYLTFPEDEGITAAEVIAQLRFRPQTSVHWKQRNDDEPTLTAGGPELGPLDADDLDLIDDLTEARQIDFNPAARGLAEIPGPAFDEFETPAPKRPAEDHASLPRDAAYAAAGVGPATWNPKPVEQQIGGDVRSLRLGPKPATTMESKPAATQHVDRRETADPQSLARHVAGLRAIRPRSPGHESIELAVDSRGDLHLLAREDSIRELAVVRRWTNAHLELLRMACPNDRIGESASIHIHLFAAQPLAVSDLHESEYHLHVLAPVEVDGRTAWYCAPLNQPR